MRASDRNQDDDDEFEVVSVSDRMLREEQAYHRLGSRASRCSVCGEDRPIALLRRGRRILCYECDSEERGRPTGELHHPFGRHNSRTTVLIGGNDHRDLTDLQTDWPKKTLRNPSKSELLASAAKIRGVVETSEVLLDGLRAVPELLERLDADISDDNATDHTDQEQDDPDQSSL